MGKDKYENEDLLKYGFPVINLYFRRIYGFTFQIFPQPMSISGCKMENHLLIFLKLLNKNVYNLLKKTQLKVDYIEN
jgi:hypothetical protein